MTPEGQPAETHRASLQFTAVAPEAMNGKGVARLRAGPCRGLSRWRSAPPECRVAYRLFELAERCQVVGRAAGDEARTVAMAPDPDREGEVIAWQVLTWLVERNAIGDLAAHRVARVRATVAQTAAELRFLPPYSPDLNPIEMAIAKLKAHLKRMAAHSNAVAHALDLFTTTECQNYFKAAGYDRA